MREPGIYADINIDEYHSEPGISSSGINLILDCPKRYQYEYLIPKEEEEKDDFVLGRAVHMLALEPNLFAKHFYPMQNDVDLRTKAGKEEYAQAEHNSKGRQIIRFKDWKTISKMAGEISAHPLWSRIKDGKVEHSVYWDGGIYNTRLRTRPDIFNDGLIIDLKTTDSIAAFKRSIFAYGYHRQAAMQIDGLEKIDGKRRVFGFFVVEKKAPHMTAVFTLDDASIELGRKQYLEGAEIYTTCMNDNNWPGYEEKFQLVELPKWLTGGEDE